jgi:hypothetical protein
MSANNDSTAGPSSSMNTPGSSELQAATSNQAASVIVLVCVCVCE